MIKYDITNLRFGRLIARYPTDLPFRKGREGERKWYCECDCGGEATVSRYNLVSGHTKSCGCIAREKNLTHGLSRTNGNHTRLFSIWQGIKYRCYNENSSRYKNYGRLGVKVCTEWINNYKNFYDWAMSNGYQEGLTIERKDVTGDYAPNNCTWISRLEQASNKRNTTYIDLFGEKKKICDLVRETGISRATLRYRYYKMGLRDCDLTAPVKKRKGRKTV